MTTKSNPYKTLLNKGKTWLYRKTSLFKKKKKTMEYLGVNQHHIDNLLANRSKEKKILCTILTKQDKNR